MRPKKWRKEGESICKQDHMTISYFSLISLSDRKHGMGQRLNSIAECTTLPCLPWFSIASLLNCRLLYFLLFLCGKARFQFRVHVCLFLLVHVVEVEHGIQKAPHSRATIHSDFKDLPLQYCMPLFTRLNKSLCLTSSYNSTLKNSFVDESVLPTRVIFREFNTLSY